jgi:predicted O-linked N-acetylglucosamine transferase (SPINDLY family)
MLGLLRYQQGRFIEALSLIGAALKTNHNSPRLLLNYAVVIDALRRHEEALAYYDKALEVNPDYAEALFNRGIALAEALASYDKALAIKPDHRFAFGGIAEAALAGCDWARTTMLAGELETRIAERRSIIPPFTLLGYGTDASLQLECTRRFVEDKMLVPAEPLWNGAIHQHDKLRIAYLSSDFRRYAVSFLMAELFELHDRAFRGSWYLLRPR